MTPAGYQLDCADHIFERDHSLVFARPGTGKTLATLIAIKDLLDARVVERVMVVAPLRVVLNVWQQEIQKWKLPLTSTICTGATKDRAGALREKTQLLIVNYEMLKQILPQDHSCDGIVVDEISKLRSNTGRWNKLVRGAGFKFAVGLTGSPTPNNLLSLYGMAKAVGLPIWGNSFDKWKRTFFYPLDYNEYQWSPKQGNTLLDDLRDYVFTLDDTAVKLPPIVRPPMVVDLPGDLRELYAELRSTSALSDHEIIAANMGVLTGKLRQIAAGFVYDNRGTPVSFNPWRIDIAADLVEELQGQPLIIVYEWREQLAMLRKQWPNAPFLGGGSKDDETTIAAWCAGKVPVLFLHPAAAGHGINMAAGGNSVCWLQPPHDQEAYEQVIGRVRRRDQPSASVFSYEIVARSTLDEPVLEKLGARAEAQEGVWAGLRLKQ